MSKEHDNVNNPKHYAGSTSLECIDAMRLVLGRKGVYYFCLGNAFKYMWRYKNKNGLEDINKAKWYLSYVEHDIDQDEDGNYVSHKVQEIFRRLQDLYIDIVDRISNYGIEEQ